MILPVKTKATQERPQNKKFWNVEQSTDENGNPSGELHLYGYISDSSWWGDEVTPKTLIDDIDSLGVIDELNVHLFSNGGDVFAGNAIVASRAGRVD